MTHMSATTDAFANSRPHKPSPSSSQSESTNSAIIRKIKEIYPTQTVPALAAWLSRAKGKAEVSFSTAKNRLMGTRQFSLEDIETLLHDEQGFPILKALMERAPNNPDWWRVCEPLMDMADAERMRLAIRKRVSRAIEGHYNADQQLEDEIRHSETLAIQGSGSARAHADALHTFARASDCVRVVAKTRRR